MYRRQENLTPEAKKLIGRHVTSLDQNIYAVRNLPPEVVAVLFAYVSRSPMTFRENLATLLQSGDLDGVMSQEGVSADPSDASYTAAAERAKKFHEKWVVGYGHASVAEHADIKFAVDDISILAAKFLENNRLGAYTEKSSRYQVFASNSFVTPPELLKEEHKELRELFEKTCRELFEVYMASFEPLQRLMAERFPRDEKTSERAYEASLKAKACDIARYLLPAATLTSLGISWNARVAEHAINKCLSSSNEEFIEIGNALLQEGRKICPTLLKHAGPKDYMRETPGELRDLATLLLGTELIENDNDLLGPHPLAQLTSRPGNIEYRLVTSILYPLTNQTYSQIANKVAWFTDEQMLAVLNAFFHRRGKFDWPLRELEHIAMQFEMEMDYGAWRDIQRHRMATLTEKPTTCLFGYDMPEEIVSAGLQDDYRRVMDNASSAFDKLMDAGLPSVAPYVVAQGFRKRVLISWNLRELEHFIRLRSGRQGHVAYRRVAQDVHRILTGICEPIARFFTCDYDDYGLGRLESEQRSDAKRAASE